jgi:uncharacterized protein YkuJ
VFFTGSMHPPYAVSNEEYYIRRLNELCDDKNVTPENKAFLQRNGKFIRTIMYFDDALNFFMKEMSKRTDFKNTIFIITGDHPITDLPFDNPLQRFNVPLIIYSPLLKSTSNFKSLNSQFDITPSLLSLLKNQYKITPPSNVIFLGTSLDTSKTFSANCYDPIMGDNRRIENLVENNYYLSEDKAYKILDGMQISEINDSFVEGTLKTELLAFDKINGYANWENYLLPDSVFYNYFNYQIIAEKNISKIESKDEYFNLVELKNTQFPQKVTCEFSCEIVDISSSEEKPQVIFDFNNGNGSTISWHANPIVRSGDNNSSTRFYNDFHKTFKFNMDSIPTGVKVYVWNEKKIRYKIGQCKLKIYTEKHN